MCGCPSANDKRARQRKQLEDILRREGELEIDTNENTKINQRKLLFDAAMQLGISLTEVQLAQFETYMSMLLEWNNKFNLTAITGPREIILKHFADCLSIVPYIGAGESIIDIGAGAGFPGIPLKIAMPDIRVTLLDALNKRVGFLNAVTEVLGLEDIHAVHMRAEDAARLESYRENYDIAVARAVASLPTLAEYALPFVRIGGRFIAMKGPSAADELALSAQAISTLGGEYSKTVSVEIPFEDITHNLVIVNKLSSTPPRFPRKASQITKKPL